MLISPQKTIWILGIAVGGLAVLTIFFAFKTVGTQTSSSRIESQDNSAEHVESESAAGAGPRIVITNYTNFYDYSEDDVKKSKWIDKSKRPQLTLVDVYSKSLQICDHLEHKNEQLGFHEWKTLNVDFQNLYLIEENCWVYVVSIESQQYPEQRGLNASIDLNLMMLMDGTILFDSKEYPRKISKAVLEFEGIRDCSAPDEIRAALYQKTKQEGGLFVP